MTAQYNQKLGQQQKVAGYPQIGNTNLWVRMGAIEGLRQLCKFF